jgi:hypothetical protein
MGGQMGLNAVPTGGTIKSTLTVPNASTGVIAYGTDNAYNFKIEKSRDINLEQIEAPAVIIIQSLADSTIKFMTNRFLLQSVTKPRMERFQIVETFREARLYFFGERTKVYSMTGQLIEALDAGAEGNIKIRDQYRWATSLQNLYDTTLRGSKLSEAGNIATLIFEKALITGYPLQLQISRTTETPYITNFQMTWAIYNENFLDYYGPTTNMIQKEIFAELKKVVEQMNKLKGEEAKYTGNKTSDEYRDTFTTPLQLLSTKYSELVQKNAQTLNI